MRKLLFAIALAFVFSLFAPNHAHAQGYWTPGNVGVAGCANVGGYVSCSSAAAACESFVVADNQSYYRLTPTFSIPSEPYQCTVYGPQQGTGPLYLTCPNGMDPDLNSPSGCVSSAPAVQAPQNAGGSGKLCLPDPTENQPTQPGQEASTDVCTGEPTNIGSVNTRDPVDVGTGNMYYSATDYTTAGQNPLRFARSFNSRSTASGALGVNWYSNFTPALYVNGSQVIVYRETGQVVTFNQSGSTWTTDKDLPLSLIEVSSTVFTMTDEHDTIQTYTNGLLTSIQARNGYLQTLNYNSGSELATVTDSYGRTLTFSYNPNGTLASVLTPDNTTITYGYTSSGGGPNLTSVTYPTSPTTSIQYVYGNSTLFNTLTGVIDENNNNYLTWTYDGNARALTGTIGNGSTANTTTFTYNDSADTRTVENTLGVTDTYTFTTLINVPKVSAISRAATATTAAAPALLPMTPMGIWRAKPTGTATRPPTSITSTDFRQRSTRR
jgi:YD repeat-containing protein